MKNKTGFTQAASRGFTLIEIVVVMVILAVLGGIVAPNLIGQIGKAEQKRVKADFKNIATALDLYRLDNSRYPTTEQGLDALVNKPESDPQPKNYKSDGYLENAPIDPWGEPYGYTYPGERGKRYDLYTLGADGIEGGEESDADIYNSEETSNSESE
ncbi:MAG: type II secretion system major pseudopilin GspG [Pseudomonadota bacterium]